MLKQVRTIFSVVLIAAFFVSTFIFSNQTAKACPPSIPATLLTLFVTSDLIILADYENERIIKKTDETEHGFYAQLERDLTIRKVYKGNSKLQKVSYAASEYKPIINNSGQSSGIRLLGFGGSVPVKVGEQYLFFLSEDENGKYYVTDNLGGIKNVDDTLGIYEENFDELEAIVKSKDNQLDKVTDWLVKAIDEPVTRWGAIQDIYNSSNYLDEKTDDFTLDESFNSYSAAIAKNLNNSQRAKISNLLMDEIQSSWFGKEPERVDYRLSEIVKKWDKVRFANYGFSVLQGLDESKLEAKLRVMEFISGIIEDGDLFDIYYEYTRIKLGKTPESRVVSLNAKRKKFEEFNSRFQTLLMNNFEIDDSK